MSVRRIDQRCGCSKRTQHVRQALGPGFTTGACRWRWTKYGRRAAWPCFPVALVFSRRGTRWERCRLPQGHPHCVSCRGEGSHHSRQTPVPRCHLGLRARRRRQFRQGATRTWITAFAAPWRVREGVFHPDPVVIHGRSEVAWLYKWCYERGRRSRALGSRPPILISVWELEHVVRVGGVLHVGTSRQSVLGHDQFPWTMLNCESEVADVCSPPGEAR